MRFRPGKRKKANAKQQSPFACLRGINGGILLVAGFDRNLWLVGNYSIAKKKFDCSVWGVIIGFLGQTFTDHETP